MLNGIIIVNKEKNYTSKDVTSIIRRIFDNPKVGHAGTLDPLATGVLVVAIGTGLKVLEYLTLDDKEYIATVKMGLLTDSFDILGNIIRKEKDFTVTKDEVEKVVNSFKGKYNQEVPKYSAVRVNGKKLYYYARNNEKVELPIREVEIKEIKLLEYNNDTFKFKVLVSKGTFIRSLIKDIGEKLNIPCTMIELERTKQGSFSIKESSTLKELEEGKFNIYPVEKALSNMLIIEADNYLENRILNGSILENRYNVNILAFKNKNGEIIGIYKTYEKDPKKIKPVKILK